MAATTRQRKPSPTNGRQAAAHRRTPRTPVNRTAELSEEVLSEVEAGQRAAIDAVKTFVDTVDQKLLPHDEVPSRRQDVVDAAMEMADRLVQTQYEFLRKVVRSAGKSLGRR